MSDDLLSADVCGALDRVGRAGIVAGVLSLNSERTVGAVVEAAAAGLRLAAPDGAAVVVVADGGSRDGTLEAARRADAGGVPVVLAARPARAVGHLSGDEGLPGKGAALRVVFAAAERVGAGACLIVDADVAAVAPEWVRRLLEPVLRGGLDLVAPVYARHMYDGMLTSFLVYPLTRALYGRRLRQPVGGHFGCSRTLARRLLGAADWESRAAQGRRLDLWVATAALAEGLAVGQAHLGPGRRGARDSGAALGAAFAEVVGTAFDLMEEYRTAWWPVVETADVPAFGSASVGVEPVSVNVDRMAATFRQGLADLMPVWRKMLAADTCEELAALEAVPEEAMRFPAPLWARVVYDGAVACHQRRLARGHLLRALIPLYLGRAAAFVADPASGDAEAAEAEVEAQCGAFEALKPYLLDRWDARRT